MTDTVAQVIVLLPSHTPPDARARPVFHYAVPDKLIGKLRPGHFVLVPFGKHTAGKIRLVSGIVKTLEVSEISRVYTGELKPIDDLLDPQPVVSETHLRLAQWMAEYYLAPLCECVRSFAPPGQTVHSDLEYALGQTTADHGPLTANQTVPRLSNLQASIIDTLRERGPLRTAQLNRTLSGKNWQAAVKPLIAQGLITVTRVLPLPRTRPNMVRFAELATPLAAISDSDLGRTEDTLHRRRRALEFLQREGRAVEVEWVYAESGCQASDLKFMEGKSFIKIRHQEVLRDPLADKEFVLAAPPILTDDQAAVWQRIKAGLLQSLSLSSPLTNHPFDSAQGKPVTLSPRLPSSEGHLVTLSPSPLVYLLHGVTGSGKTELYLRAVAHTLQAGRQAIVLVPEISLTPQTIRRFARRFPGQVASWHSQMSPDEKYDTWRRIRAGEVDVVIGARSALFSPLERLGLIVIDEEHESSYKQDVENELPFDLPPYHARETAIELARLTHSIVILGSATPSLEAYSRAQRGEFTLLELPQRILSHNENIRTGQSRYQIKGSYQAIAGTPEARFIELPPVHMVDMRQELRAGNRHIFSRALQTALANVLENHQQAILFLNRRGSATFVLCRDCGLVLACPRCDLPLTYHEIQNSKFQISNSGDRRPTTNFQSPISNPQSPLLICHQCNHQELIPAHCPKCNSARIKYFGLGTQRVEKMVADMFPQARVLRWDADTSTGRGVHELFLQQFIEGRADIMVGTQMIAKGLDLPMVTLVGVISADTALRLPDLRAAERTFQLLAQVAGRAGRGLMGGQVIVQTYTPEHYAIQCAAQHDYTDFAKKELAFRRQMDYPPYSRLARLVVRDSDSRRAQREAERMAATLRQTLKVHGLNDDALIGPAPCILGRIRDQYRWQIVLRAADPAAILHTAPLSPNWRVDIDPINLL